MKITTKLTLLATCFITLASCGSKQQFTITGTLPDNTFEGQEAILYNGDTRAAVDTVLVEGNAFKFYGNVESSEHYQIAFNNRYISVFVTPGDFTFNAVEDKVAKEGAINASYASFLEKMEELNKKQMELYKGYQAGEIEEAEIEKQFKVIETESNAILKDTYTQNKDNALGVNTLLFWANSMKVEEFNTTINEASEYLLSKESIKKLIVSKKALAETSVGCMFKDFTVEQPDGSKVSLSDYVGKGKFVLVDFWASWCGPCVAEIPHIKEVNKEFAGDKFQVLGVATWDAPEDTEKAIATHEIPWSNIMNAQKLPAETYGINGIPCLILFAPDGTIVARGDELRGDGMKKVISEALAK